jgi:hypothetical protein
VHQKVGTLKDVTELVKRAERLRSQMEILRAELDELRHALGQMAARSNSQSRGRRQRTMDCLAVALAMAEDLGPEFSSENPIFAGRGDGWIID